MFRIGQKVKVINIDVFSTLIEINDIGIITDVDERHEEYEIYFSKKKIEQWCPIHCSKTYLELSDEHKGDDK